MRTNFNTIQTNQTAPTVPRQPIYALPEQIDYHTVLRERRETYYADLARLREINAILAGQITPPSAGGFFHGGRR